MAHVHPARHLLRARDLIDARYRDQLDVHTLARAARLSPAQYLLIRRLERAALLLRTTDRTVAEICLTVGLRSVGSFTTSFGRTFGMSPTAYRAAHPPAARRARVPTCVLLAWARPRTARFEKTTS
ncbi:MAG: helix-turn-helix transcriptional regulator [Actinobacteria bacterium]|nr:MAG: helix-turn-helix transcriptional regulator [Actinomycetota bacterium]